MNDEELTARAERAKTTLALYDNAMEAYRREEALWQEVDMLCAGVRDNLFSAASDAQAEAMMTQLAELGARRNGHGMAANAALEQANAAHAQLLAIIADTGIDPAALEDGRMPPAQGSLH